MSDSEQNKAPGSSDQNPQNDEFFQLPTGVTPPKSSALPRRGAEQFPSAEQQPQQPYVPEQPPYAAPQQPQYEYNPAPYDPAPYGQYPPQQGYQQPYEQQQQPPNTYYQPPQNQYGYPANPTGPVYQSNNYSMIALGLSISGIVLCCCPLIPIALGAAGAAMGHKQAQIAKQNNSTDMIATLAFWLGIAAIVIALLFFVQQIVTAIFNPVPYDELFQDLGL